jgi:hypothetical protein
MSSEEPGNGGDARPDLGDTGMPEATPPPPPPPAASTPPPPPPPPPSTPATPAAGAPSSVSSFDPASVPRSVWISAGGSLVLLISVFLTWYSFSIIGVSGWDSGSLGKLVALLALVAVGVWGVELFAPTVTLPAPAWMIAGGAGAISVVFVLIKIVDKPSPGGWGTSFGIWLALVAAIAVVAGAYLRMNETSS